MLSQLDGKRGKITTEDGCVYTGKAESFPSGCGLHISNVEEESLKAGGLHIFQPQNRKAELTNEPAAAQAKECQALVDQLLDGPCWIVDILPERVPKECGGQYFAVERYFLRTERMERLRQKYAELLLRLNCYWAMTVSFDGGESWERNPDPEEFVRKLTAISGGAFLRALFLRQGIMIDLEAEYTWMTVYCREDAPPDLIGKLTAGEGLFLWKSEE